MGVKPEMAFDVCWEVYRCAKEVLEAKRGMSALKPEEATKYLWRPDVRPRINKWAVDFALAGKAALDGPDWASRMVLFRLYYLGLASYLLSGTRVVREGPPFSRLERKHLGAVDRANSQAMWQRIAAARHVSAAKIFYFGDVTAALRWRCRRAARTAGRYVRTSASPTRRSLPGSDGGTHVLVARR
jgi:hypothetical protein